MNLLIQKYHLFVHSTQETAQSRQQREKQATIMQIQRILYNFDAT